MKPIVKQAKLHLLELEREYAAAPSKKLMDKIMNIKAALQEVINSLRSREVAQK